jgi:hypothetical protein
LPLLVFIYITLERIAMKLAPLEKIAKRAQEAKEP